MRRSIHHGLCGIRALAIAGAAGAAFVTLAAQAPTPGGEAARAGGAPALFAGACAGCHGTDLAGGRGPSLFNARLLASAGDARLRAAILNGIAGTEMPAFKGNLDDRQVTSILAYLHDRAAQLGADAAPHAAAAAPAVPPPPDPDGQRIHSEKQDFRIETVAGGLDTPWGLAFLPDGRLLVTERSGGLRVVDVAGKRASAPVQGLPAVHTGQDAGLLDVAAGPDYAHDGWVYLAYVDDDPQLAAPPPPAPGTPSYLVKRKPSMTVVVRGRIDAANRWVDQQDIFRQPYASYTASGMHYGCRLLFDGKGHLFFTIGERGEMKNAQRLDVPLGKVHRVNLDGSIPADNPFVHTPGAVPSIWSYGHRNPEGLAIDPASGLLWESEHGPVGGDEINVITKGRNYGWGVVSMGVQPGIMQTAAPGMEPPAAWYFPTIAPGGIGFYRGDRYPGWKGSLFVTGLRGQQLRRLTVKGRQVVSQEILFAQLGRVRAVATGPDGLLYVLISNPTGPGTGLDLSDPVPGEVVRLLPITWAQPEKPR